MEFWLFFLIFTVKMYFSNLEILSWHYPKGFVKPRLVIYFSITFITSMVQNKLEQSIQGKGLSFCGQVKTNIVQGLLLSLNMVKGVCNCKTIIIKHETVKSEEF